MFHLDKPVRISLSGTGAEKWVGFAKSKLKQWRELGLLRKTLDVAGARIEWVIGEVVDQVRIVAGGYPMPVLYSSSSGDMYGFAPEPSLFYIFINGKYTSSYVSSVSYSDNTVEEGDDVHNVIAEKLIDYMQFNESKIDQGDYYRFFSLARGRFLKNADNVRNLFDKYGFYVIRMLIGNLAYPGKYITIPCKYGYEAGHTNKFLCFRGDLVDIAYNEDEGKYYCLISTADYSDYALNNDALSFQARYKSYFLICSMDEYLRAINDEEGNYVSSSVDRFTGEHSVSFNVGDDSFSVSVNNKNGTITADESDMNVWKGDIKVLKISARGDNGKIEIRAYIDIKSSSVTYSDRYANVIGSYIMDEKEVIDAKNLYENISGNNIYFVTHPSYPIVYCYRRIRKCVFSHNSPYTLIYVNGELYVYVEFSITFSENGGFDISMSANYNYNNVNKDILPDVINLYRFRLDGKSKTLLYDDLTGERDVGDTKAVYGHENVIVSVLDDAVNKPRVLIDGVDYGFFATQFGNSGVVFSLMKSGSTVFGFGGYYMNSQEAAIYYKGDKILSDYSTLYAPSYSYTYINNNVYGFFAGERYQNHSIVGVSCIRIDYYYDSIIHWPNAKDDKDGICIVRYERMYNEVKNTVFKMLEELK